MEIRTSIRSKRGRGRHSTIGVSWKSKTNTQPTYPTFYLSFSPHPIPQCTWASYLSALVWRSVSFVCVVVHSSLVCLFINNYTTSYKCSCWGGIHAAKQGIMAYNNKNVLPHKNMMYIGRGSRMLLLLHVIIPFRCTLLGISIPASFNNLYTCFIVQTLISHEPHPF